jgi:predicted RNA-binding Zn-ribbon protein involved in translation (DUF1610 family)
MYYIDDRDLPVYSCPECGWEGHKEDMADEGPGHELCCPECGCDMPVDLLD